MEIDELSDNIFFICLVVLKIVQIICENHGKMPDCVWWQAQPAIQWGRHNGGQEIQLTLSHDANKNLECVWVLLMTKNEGPFNFCDDYLLFFQWQWHNREGQQLLERLFKWIYIQCWQETITLMIPTLQSQRGSSTKKGRELWYQKDSFLLDMVRQTQLTYSSKCLHNWNLPTVSNFIFFANLLQTFNFRWVGIENWFCLLINMQHMFFWCYLQVHGLC